MENVKKNEGYIPRLYIGEGIYAEDTIVKYCKGKAYIKLANGSIHLKSSRPL